MTVNEDNEAEHRVTDRSAVQKGKTDRRNGDAARV